METGKTMEASPGGSVDASIADAWRTWRAQYARNIPQEKVWCEHIKRLTAGCDVLQAGRVRITVKIEATRPWQSETYWYQWQRVEQNHYVLMART